MFFEMDSRPLYASRSLRLTRPNLTVLARPLVEKPLVLPVRHPLLGTRHDKMLLELRSLESLTTFLLGDLTSFRREEAELARRPVRLRGPGCARRWSARACPTSEPFP
jgi:hypothetical protein